MTHHPSEHDHPQTNPMPAPLPPTPDNGMPPSGAPVPAQSASSTPNTPEILGIISLVMAFVGLSVVGLILGLVGTSKAKKQHTSPVLPRVGWIVNLVFSVLAVLFIGLIIWASVFTSHNANDIKRKNDMSYYHNALEIYYNAHSYYPKDLLTLPASNSTSYNPLPIPYDYKYTPSPTGCVKCTSYILTSPTENVQPDGSRELRVKSLHGQPLEPASSET